MPMVLVRGVNSFPEEASRITLLAQAETPLQTNSWMLLNLTQPDPPADHARGRRPMAAVVD
jgi:hypothetical protein